MINPLLAACAFQALIKLLAPALAELCDPLRAVESAVFAFAKFRRIQRTCCHHDMRVRLLQAVTRHGRMDGNISDQAARAGGAGDTSVAMSAR